MPDLKTTTYNKNVLPAFSQGKYDNIVKAISDGKLTPPAFIYFTDKSCLGFLDSKGELHVILWDEINELTQRLDEATQGLINPETGEEISVVTYVTESVVPVQEQVTTVTQQAIETQTQVEKLSNAITMITSQDIKEEVTD